MRTRSVKRAKQEREYSKLRKEYLLRYTTCAVNGCNNESTEIHHQKGRIGDLLTDTKYFLPVCPVCHTLIELHPIWAKNCGYSLSRLAKEEV